MNHVLQYTQLKFKFDPLMKLEILGLIPNEVANLWTLPQSTNRRDSRFKIIRVWKCVEKTRFLSFGKSVPDEERFCLESPLTFIFIFEIGKIK